MFHRTGRTEGKGKGRSARGKRNIDEHTTVGWVVEDGSGWIGYKEETITQDDIESLARLAGVIREGEQDTSQFRTNCWISLERPFKLVFTSLVTGVMHILRFELESNVSKSAP